MVKKKKIIENIIKRWLVVGRRLGSFMLKVGLKALFLLELGFLFLHRHTTEKIHHKLKAKWPRYSHLFEGRQRKRTKITALASIGIFALVFGLIQFGNVLALSDLISDWDFSNPSDYTKSSEIDLDGSTASLKVQEYSSDANTMGLYHFNESSGSTAADNSSHNNDATLKNSSFGPGNLNNALNLNGTTSSGTVPNSASLEITKDNTVEGWTKFNDNFSAGSNDRRQAVVDKGDYQLYFDNETGKAVYELANKDANTWTQEGGNSLNGSWDQTGKNSVLSQVKIGSNVYVGIGSYAGDAEVWRWDGSSWTQIGGGNPAINGSWAANAYAGVYSMETDGTNLYVGLGVSVTQGEVWKWDGSSWTQIGGDGLNNSWSPSIGYAVYSLEYIGGKLYAGLGGSTAEVWEYSGSSWTRIGARNFNGAWAVNATQVLSMTNDGSNLYVGLSGAAGVGEVWRWSGSAWTKLGGGTGLNGSWGNTIESVRSLKHFGGNLYAGTGDTAGDGDVWKFSGGSWSQIGGDGLNNGWPGGAIEYVVSMASDGTNLYAGLGGSDGDGQVWKFDGSNWSKIGGNGVNSGWTTAQGDMSRTLMFADGKLYSGLVDISADGLYFEWDGSSWERLGGAGVNQSWVGYGIMTINVMQAQGGYLYAGAASGADGGALVYQFDGSRWRVVGGAGVNGSWPISDYRQIMSMASYKGKLYVGTGNIASGARADGDIWEWDGSTWTKVAGDGARDSWNVPPVSHFGEVDSMASYDGYLYAGLGAAATDGQVWRYDGSTWEKIASGGINGSWTNYAENVHSMAVYGNNLYVGIGRSTGDAEVWKWDGSSWSRVGGKGLNNSWDGGPITTESVESLMPYNGKLYAGLGNTVGDGTLWEFDGTDWTKVAGDGVNGSWVSGQYEKVKSIVVYNGNLYVGLGSTTGDGEVWQLSASGWTKIGGNGTNNSWPYTVDEISSFSPYKGKLYAGTGIGAGVDAMVYSWGDNLYLESDKASFDTDWHHLAATYDGSTAKLYVDGVVDKSKNKTLTMPTSGRDLIIGQTYGGRESGKPVGAFDGQIDELRISNTARSTFNSKSYPTSRQTVQPNDAVRKSGVWHWDSFIADESGGGEVKYRLSDNDGTDWKYWDGSAWVASADLGQASSESDVDGHINDFPVNSRGILWQAILKGDGSQKVTLDKVTIEATSDNIAPSSSSVSVTAKKSHGGSTLAENNWTNGLSPEFSWSAGSDGESGIKGYCLYLGDDQSANPSSAKGILGTNGVDPGDNCQFLTTSTSLDTATAGYLASALNSSNDKYYLIIKTVDKAGNISSDAASFSFKFDNTPPTNPSFISAPSGFVSDKAVTLTWPITGGAAPDDANSGLAGLQYRIGSGGIWYGSNHTGNGDQDDLLVNSGSYTMQNTPDFANLNDGVNTVYFRAFDNAGNISQGYATAAIKLNTSGAPSEPLNLSASPPSSSSNAFGFSWDQPATFVGDADNLVYCYTINVVPDNTNCAFTARGVTGLASGPYATKPGENRIYVVAKDESSNINYSSYASTTFDANTTAPGMPLATDIADVSIKATNKWRLALTWEDPTNVGSGVAKYNIFRSTDGTNYSQVGSSSSTTYIDAGLQQDIYYYKVKACDNTNNCGAFGTVVSAKPTGKFTEPANITSPPTVSGITTKRATISWGTDRDSDSKIAIGTASGQYGSSEIYSSAQAKDHTIKLNNLAAGTTYYFIAKWTDEDGNTGRSQEYTFKTASPPILKEIQAKNVSLSGATIEFTSKNANKVNVYYGPSESFGGVKPVNTSLKESTYTVNLDNLSDGSKQFFKLVSYDSEGTAYNSSVQSFTTPARPRITNLRFQPISGKPTSTQRVTWNTNVPTTTGVTYGKLGSSGAEARQNGMTTNHSITISDLEDDSDYFLVAQSRDASGNLATSDRQAFRTALDTRPPKVSNITVEPSIRGTGTAARGQVVVSWRTDEPATSQVAYGEGAGLTSFSTKSAEDTALAFEHIVIVSDLPTSRVYSVQPVSYDKARNEGRGKVQPSIIGRASDDVLTIILNSLKVIFGF